MRKDIPKGYTELKEYTKGVCPKEIVNEISEWYTEGHAEGYDIPKGIIKDIV